jgi:hypothetical protein
VSRQVVFEPEASAELEEAARWYEAQRSGLGLAFLAAVASQAALAEHNATRYYGRR